MDSSVFDRLTRLFAASRDRRAALAATVASGLVAITAETGRAQDGSRRPPIPSHRGRRGPRGPRGPQGNRGPKGPPGPPAGSGIVQVNQPCSEDYAGGPPEDPQRLRTCIATCPNGYVATGGGFEIGPFQHTLAIVRASEPNPQNGDPTGWMVRIQFLDIGQDFTYIARALCAPQ